MRRYRIRTHQPLTIASSRMAYVTITIYISPQRIDLQPHIQQPSQYCVVHIPVFGGCVCETCPRSEHNSIYVWSYLVTSSKLYATPHRISNHVIRPNTYIHIYINIFIFINDAIITWSKGLKDNKHGSHMDHSAP